MITPKKPLNTQTEEQITRVAFYDRNRVTRDTPLSVIELQNSSFRQLLKDHPEWSNIGIYRDLDIIGEPPGNRPEFDRLVSDCEKGLIDLIVVKNVSKISRNIVELVEKVSSFRSMQPAVQLYFLHEDIDTRKSNYLSPFEYMYNLMKESEQKSMTAKEPKNTRNSPGKYDSKAIKKKSKIHRKRKTRGK